jgi:prohibitin 1
VNLTLRVLHRPEVARLPEIHTNLGPEYEERVLPSIGNEVLKATVAQFNADQLLTMRDEVSKRVSFALRKRAEDFGIVLEDVALTHLSFGVEYSRAIEAKQVSQQDAERSKFVVLRSEQEREAAVIRAEGESESARLISQATKSAGPALVELRRIEAAREVAQTLSRSRNVMYLPGGNSNMLLGVNP